MWQSLTLDDIRYQGNGLRINKVHLQQPYVRFIINRDMSTNFSDLVRAQPEREAPAAEGEPFGIRIGGISIADGSANFADFSLTPNFATGIEQLNGSIGTLDNQRTQAARVDLQGKVDRYAPVTIRGELTPFDPLNSLDIATSIADGSANSADVSLTPNLATGTEQLNGSIGPRDNQRTQAARVDLQGKVDRYAPVTIRGELTPFDPLNSLDIATSFKNVELT